MAASQVAFFWSIIKDTFTFFHQQRKEGNKNIADAHKAVNSAFIKTYDYLRNNAGTYIPKPDLAEAGE